MSGKDRLNSLDKNDKDQEVVDRDADFTALGKDMCAADCQACDKGEDVDADGDEQWRVKYEKLLEEYADIKDKYIRGLAELENYRKRTMRDRSDLLKYQGEGILFDILSVVDDIERALAHSEADPGGLKQGLELIYKSFVDVLNKWEVRGETAVGQQFDPVKHNALSKIVVQDATPGVVINELKKAYFYKDKILRHGDVVVAVAEDKKSDGFAEAEKASVDSE